MKKITTLDNYSGHKKIDGLYQKIINQIPKHNFYAELFAGSASVYSVLTVRDPYTIILNDINPEVHKLLVEKYIGTNEKVHVYNRCAIAFLKKMESVWSNDVFVFLDPPYLHETRPNNTEVYPHEMTVIEHLKLLNAVRYQKSNVMIMHPKCELYDEFLHDWRKVEIKVRYNRKTSIECLYMNYPEPIQLQDYSYLGRDCWERQRIKRKTEAYINKFKKMPVLERNCIIEKLNELNK